MIGVKVYVCFIYPIYPIYLLTYLLIYYNWDVSKVTDIHGMFAGEEDFNKPLDNWDVSKVTNMGAMFW